MPSSYDYTNPGVAAADALEMFLAERAVRKRQAMMDQMTQERERRAAEQEKNNEIRAKEDQDFQRVEHKQRVKDAETQAENQRNDREVAKAKQIKGDMQKGDIPDASIVDLFKRTGMMGGIRIAPPNPVVGPMPEQPMVGPDPMGAEPGSVMEPGAEPGMAMEPERAEPYAGTPEQQKRDAFRATLSPDSPVAQWLDVQDATGENIPAGLLQADTPRTPTAAIQEYEYYVSEEQKAGNTPLSFDAYQARDANRKTPAASATRLGDLTDAQFRRSQQLEADFVRDSKDFIERTNSYRTINSAAQDSSAAGDLSIIFAYMKMLDPGSVVREGEFATAQNTASVPDRVRNAYNKLLTGERLAPEQRKDFIRQAGNIYRGARSNQATVKTRYAGRAKAAGVPTEFVTTDFDTDLPANEALATGEATPTTTLPPTTPVKVLGIQKRTP